MKKLYLFRHGETNWNVSKEIKYSEQEFDSDVTEIGIEQAKKNALKLKDKNIKHIYSSNFRRTKKTAKPLADLLNIQIETKDGLEELNLYDESIFGLTRLEAKEKLGLENCEIFAKQKDALMDWRPCNCETKREARNRISTAVKCICENTPFDIIAIASHGSILKEFLRFCDYEDDSKIGNCEAIEVDYNEGKFNVIRRIKNDE